MTYVPPGAGGAGGAPAQPGRVYPLRRLSLGEVLGGGFSLIRHAPKAVLGVPFVAGLVSFLGVLLIYAVAPSNDLFRMMYDPAAFEDPQVATGAVADLWFLVVSVVMTMLQFVIMGIAYGLIAVAALRAAYGFGTDFGQVFRIAAGRIGPLLGHVLLIALLSAGAIVLTLTVAVLLVVLATTALHWAAGVVLGLLLIPPAALLALWLIVGLMHAPLVIIVEERGPIAAIARSWVLNRGLWWRHIGTVALIIVMIFAVTSVLTIPMSLLMGVGMSTAWMGSGPEEGTVVSFMLLTATTFFDSMLTALVVGLSAAMVCLLYLNARVHRESLDVALLTAAVQTTDDGAVLPGSPAHLGAPSRSFDPAAQSPPGGGFGPTPPAAGTGTWMPGQGGSGQQPPQPGWPRQQPPQWGPHGGQPGDRQGDDRR